MLPLKLDLQPAPRGSALAGWTLAPLTPSMVTTSARPQRRSESAEAGYLAELLVRTLGAELAWPELQAVMAAGVRQSRERQRSHRARPVAGLRA